MPKQTIKATVKQKYSRDLCEVQLEDGSPTYDQTIEPKPGQVWEHISSSYHYRVIENMDGEVALLKIGGTCVSTFCGGKDFMKPAVLYGYMQEKYKLIKDVPG